MLSYVPNSNIFYYQTEESGRGKEGRQEEGTVPLDFESKETQCELEAVTSGEGSTIGSF